MRPKRLLWIGVVLITIAISLQSVYSQSSSWLHSGFQISTLDALNQGVYKGAIDFGALKQQGNFGLGTFEGLDGEMIALNGKFYQVKADGIAYPVTNEMQTPFAAMTFFRREQTIRLPGPIRYQDLQQRLDRQLSTRNLPYAIRIQGTFPSLTLRSVPKQAEPYPPLSDVVNRQQQVFELQNVRGTLVGFRMPQYLKSVNAVGYHFHFLTHDRKAGGHVLSGNFLNPVADIETLYNWQMMLPNHTAFAQAPLE
jgi:acetolactate decarboxylase